MQPMKGWLERCAARVDVAYQATHRVDVLLLPEGLRKVHAFDDDEAYTRLQIGTSVVLEVDMTALTMISLYLSFSFSLSGSYPMALQRLQFFLPIPAGLGILGVASSSRTFLS